MASAASIAYEAHLKHRVIAIVGQATPLARCPRPDALVARMALSQGWVCVIRSDCSLSQAETTGPMEGSSLGPMIARPRRR